MSTTKSTDTRPAEPTAEEKDMIDSLIYGLFLEAAEDLEKQTEEEKAADKETLAHFAEIEGVSSNSPYVMMFAGFRLGVAKGLSLADRVERAAAEEGATV